MADRSDQLASWGDGATPAAPGAATDVAKTRDRSKPPRNLLVVVVLAAAVAVGLVVVLGQGGSAPSTPLNGANFATVSPGGYRLAITHPFAGTTNYQLTSPVSTQVPALILGSPPAGIIEISIATGPTSFLAQVANDPTVDTQTPLQLFAATITQPPGATDVVPSVPAHATRLNPLPAAAGTYTYTDNGVQYVQSDVIGRNGLAFYDVELDTTPALAAQGTSAMNKILANWEWIGTP